MSNFLVVSERPVYSTLDQQTKSFHALLTITSKRNNIQPTPNSIKKFSQKKFTDCQLKYSWTLKYNHWGNKNISQKLFNKLLMTYTHDTIIHILYLLLLLPSILFSHIPFFFWSFSNYNLHALNENWKKGRHLNKFRLISRHAEANTTHNNNKKRWNERKKMEKEKKCWAHCSYFILFFFIPFVWLLICILVNNNKKNSNNNRRYSYIKVATKEVFSSQLSVDKKSQDSDNALWMQIYFFHQIHLSSPFSEMRKRE